MNYRYRALYLFSLLIPSVTLSLTPIEWGIKVKDTTVKVGSLISAALTKYKKPLGIACLVTAGHLAHQINQYTQDWPDKSAVPDTIKYFTLQGLITTLCALSVFESTRYIKQNSNLKKNSLLTNAWLAVQTFLLYRNLSALKWKAQGGDLTMHPAFLVTGTYEFACDYPTITYGAIALGATTGLYHAKNFIKDRSEKLAYDAFKTGDLTTATKYLNGVTGAGAHRETLLGHAVLQCDMDVACRLLEDRAHPLNLDYRYSDGTTLLYQALAQRDLTMAGTLIKYGANIHAPSSRGISAAQYAAASKDTEMQDVVLSKEAFTTKTNLRLAFGKKHRLPNELYTLIAQHATGGNAERCKSTLQLNESTRTLRKIDPELPRARLVASYCGPIAP